MKNEEPINTDTINKKVENLIKDKIKDKGLVSTGHLLYSIKVTSTSTGFNIKAADYFKYLNSEYHILDEVFASKEFKTLLGKLAVQQTADLIRQELKKEE